MIRNAIYAALFLTITICAYGQKISTVNTPSSPLFSVGDTAYGYVRIFNPSPSPTILNKVELVSGVDFVIDSGPTLPFELVNDVAEFRVLFIPLSPGYKYDTAVFYFIENGREATDAVVVSGYADPLDINKDVVSATFDKISVSPNPAKSIAKCIYSIDEAVDLSIDLLDILGKVVQKVKPQMFHPKGVYEAAIDISTLSSGTYFCRMQSRVGVATSILKVQR